MPDTSSDTETLVVLTADIVSAHLGRNVVEISDIPLLIRNVHQALAELETAGVAAGHRQLPGDAAFESRLAAVDLSQAADLGADAILDALA